MRIPISPSQRAVSDNDFEVEERRYRDWLSFVFDREPTPNGWYFDMDLWPPEFGAGPVETVGLLGKTACRSGTDLRVFDNTKVYHGLTYIFSGTCSDHANSFASDEVPIDLKVAALQAMKNLYKDCLEPRCGPFLGHLNEGSDNPLNMFAYMLWDTTPINYINRNIERVNGVIMEVMEFALGLNNEACIESALHGLGHAHLYSPHLVEPIIDRFLESSTDAGALTSKRSGASRLRPLRREVREYARRAKHGAIL